MPTTVPPATHVETQRAPGAPSPLLAGLSFISAYNLKHSEDEYMCICAAGPGTEPPYVGKYMGYITTLEGRVTVSGEPTHDSAEAAQQHMRDVVAAARAWDGKHPTSR